MHVDMAALVHLTTEKTMPLEPLIQAIEAGVLTAYGETQEPNRYAQARLNRETGEIQIFIPIFNELGERIGEEVDSPEGFSKVTTSTARQVIKQAMRATNDAEIVGEFTTSVGDVISGVIQQGRDPKMVNVNLGRIEGRIPPQEQVPGEVYEHGARIKCFVVEVKQGMKGPEIMLSRSHPGLVKQLFALEVPEVKDGIVEIMGVAREAGHRTKIAVLSNDPNVDPVGACVGARGGRVRMVVNELRGEKIDIVSYSEDLHDFVSKALSPAKVTEVRLSEDSTQADVIVPDFQLSLAIGKEGQNARLAARLTGVRIDIKSETQAVNESNGIFEPRQSQRKTEYAEGEWRKNDETGELQFHNTDGSVVSEQEWAGGSSSDSESTEA